MSSDGPEPPDYGPLAEAEKRKAELEYEARMRAIDEWKRHIEQVRSDFKSYRDQGEAAMAAIDAGWKNGQWEGKEWKGSEALPEWMGGETKLNDWKETSDIPEWAGGRKVTDLGDPSQVPEWQGGRQVTDWKQGEFNIEDFDPSTVNLEEDPGYQFRLQEGLKAVRRAAAAGSGARGGATMKALTRYGQGMASQEFQSAYDRAVGRYKMDRQNVGMRRDFARDDYLLNRQNEMQRAAWQRDDYMIRRENEATMYDRDMDQARFNRENELTRAAWQRDDYTIAAEIEAERRRRAMQGHMMANQNIMTERSMRERDYALEYQRQQDQRQREYQDWLIEQQRMNEMYNKRERERNAGQAAVAGTAAHAAQGTGAISNNLVGGAQAMGAGLVGAANAGINQVIANNAYSQQHFNNVMQFLGMVAGIATAPSDRRVKRDIQRIGTTKNGLPWYRFRFVGDTDWSYGVMADEVERMDPKSVVIEHGTKHVDYRRAMAVPVPGAVRPPTRRKTA